MSIAAELLNSPLLTLLGVTLATLVFLYFYLRPNHVILDVPCLYPTKDLDFRNALLEGAAKYPDSLFKIKTTNVETVILPNKYIDEIKSIPEDRLSFQQDGHVRLEGRHTLLATVSSDSTFATSVRVDLTRDIKRGLEDLQDEVEFAVKESLGEAKDWKPVVLYSKLVRIIALLSGRVFVGLPLSRNEEWIRGSIDSTIDSFTASVSLWDYHWFIRPFVAPFLKEVRTIHKGLETSSRLLKPILLQRIAEAKHGEQKPHNDMVQYLMSNSTKDKVNDIPYQVQLQTAISIAAIHTTSMNATQAMYDLAARPEYVEPLREEVMRVYAEEGSDVLTKQSMVKLRKMDSFIKESQRLNPPAITSMQRRVMTDLTLSDGTFLPKGTFIAMNAHAIVRNPEVWENPDEFDGFRFEKLRAIEGNENKHQFVTTTTNNLAFGHGIHACPGRFFASNEIKVLLAYLLTHYDIKYKDGQSRPLNAYNNNMVMPDTTAELLVKLRDV